MPNAPYLTAEEFRIDTSGLDISGIADGELENILLRSSQLIDDDTGTTFEYREVANEQQNWLGFYKQIRLKRSPIRVIRGVRIVGGPMPTFGNGMNSFQTTPTGPSWITPPDLPTIFGDIEVDRDDDMIQIAFVPGLESLWGISGINNIATPKLYISYSSGYNPEFENDGVTPHTAPDGYSLPYPTWLKEATRATAVMVLNKRELIAEGLGEFDTVRQGDAEFRRYRTSGRGSAAKPTVFLPDEALVYLKRRNRTVLL